MPVNQLDGVEARDRTEQLFRIALWLFAGAIGFSIAGMLLLQAAWAAALLGLAQLVLGTAIRRVVIQGG